MDGRYDQVHGVDLIFFDKANQAVIFHEAKYRTNKTLELAVTNSGQQLSREWLSVSLNSLMVYYPSNPFEKYAFRSLVTGFGPYVDWALHRTASVAYEENHSLSGKIYSISDANLPGPQENSCFFRPTRFADQHQTSEYLIQLIATARSNQNILSNRG